MVRQCTVGLMWQQASLFLECYTDSCAVFMKHRNPPPKTHQTFFLCFVNHPSLYNFVNKANMVHNFSQYVYFFSLHVSGNYVSIIRRNNCTYAILGICHRVINTKCRINTVISPDDGHTVTQNIQRKEINILRTTVHQVGFIYKITSDLFVSQNSNA